MSFLEALRQGHLGVRFDAGEGFEPVEVTDAYAELRRPADTTAWRLTALPFRLGLHPEHDALLRSDVERQLRAQFQAQYEALASQRAPGGGPPRTSDPDWSPLIELGRVAVAGGAALRLLYRTAYEPGLEIVEGLVLIPVAQGLVQFKVQHVERFTGTREAALLEAAMAREPKADPLTLIRRLGQAGYDDPAEDARFPAHGLSRVRGALAWLLDPARGGLQVTEPLPPPALGEVLLPELGCALTPPPRYSRMPAEAVGLGPRMAMFTRPVGAEVRMLDVWHSPETLPRKGGRAEQLAECARRNAREWVEEGAADIEMDTRVLTEEGGVAHVANYIRFLARGRPTQAATRWLADTDGAVFRISVTGPLYLSREELFAEADAVVRSWRRLPGGSAPPRKPWWKFW